MERQKFSVITSDILPVVRGQLEKMLLELQIDFLPFHSWGLFFFFKNWFYEVL